MKSFRTQALVFALAATIAGCGVKDERYNPERYQVTGTAKPAGVVATFQGIYSQAVHGAVIPECCWIGPRAIFEVALPPRGRTLHLWIYNADIVPQPQKITVSVLRNSVRLASKTVHVGFSHIELPLSDRFRNRRTLLVTVRCEKYFEPQKTGAKYGVILQSAYVD